MFTPSLKTFLHCKDPTAIFKKKPLGTLDPLGIYQNLAPLPPSFLLESARGPERTSRYSFIGLEPFLILEAKANKIRLTKEGACNQVLGHPLQILSGLLKQFHVPRPRELPPFFGGALGYFGYDLIRLLENLPGPVHDDLALNDVFLAFFETVVAVDHAEKALYIIFCPTREKFFTSDRERLYHHAMDQLNKVESRLSCTFSPPPGNLCAKSSPSKPLQASLSREEYIKRVKRCKEYIGRGDIFQANLSVRFSLPFPAGTPLDLYAVLREVNPSPFAAFLDLGKVSLISSSPERLVRVSGRTVETRPIAGTRPRGRDHLQDQEMRANLLTNPKERAEHLMLLDLERNDLGRVCEYGSIKVDEFMIAEHYSHVMHIVSNIQGRLRKDRDCLNVLQAVFPGGTITGVPKIRCMEIIDELEPVARGVYTGSAGYISFAGDMDLNILIRSILVKEDLAHIQVGAGIVAESNPQKEYQECLYKAQALLKSIQITQNRSPNECRS